jgi:hypothetical protein
MAKNYTVVSGDTLTAIARKHGFSDWRTIYNDPSNAPFRAKRPNPDRIFPGDEIVIPDSGGAPVPPSPPKLLPPLPFIVTGPRFLIGQPTVTTCWAACMAMFKSWKAGTKLEIRDVLKTSAKHLFLFDQKRGLPAEELEEFGNAFGLKGEPENPAVVKAVALGPVKPFDAAALDTRMFSPAVFLSLMSTHGLLIVASFTKDGSTLNLGGHVRVMYGMEGSLTDVADCRVHLLDPFTPITGVGRDVTVDFATFILEYFTMFFTFHRTSGTAKLTQILHA